LERLADILRTKDTRAGFEAVPDMLSITGMTLDQFADLMQGLGYAGERGERPKARPAPAIEATAEDIAAQAEAEAASKHVAPEIEVEAPAAAEPVEADADADADAAPAEVPAEELEVFYTFRWAPRPRNRGDQNRRSPRRDAAAQPAGDTPQADRKPREGGGPRQRKDGESRGPKGQGDRKGKGGKPAKRDGPRREQQPRNFSASPDRKRDRIDPDNPFAAALMGLKDAGKTD